MKKGENGRFLAKNGKPIALLFGQNMVFLGTFLSCVRKWRKVKMDDFLAKNGKPIALLFGQNMVFLGTL